MSNRFDLRGKTAWITESSVDGLGHYHAIALAEEGVNLAEAIYQQERLTSMKPQG